MCSMVWLCRGEVPGDPVEGQHRAETRQKIKQHSTDNKVHNRGRQWKEETVLKCNSVIERAKGRIGNLQ